MLLKSLRGAPVDEAIHLMQELKVFDSFKTHIKNELQMPAEDLSARFARVLSPLRLLFTLHA